jgi:heme oxygenase
MTNETTTLMDSLKQQIRERHLQIERLPYITALTDGSLPLQSYVGQLRAMAVIHGTLEFELGQQQLTGLTTLFLSRPSRLAHLRSDLSSFDSQHLPDCLEALEQARLIAEQIRRYRLEQPELLLAVLYVLEGTTLGNAVHLPDLERCFGAETAGASSRYYNGYGDLTAGYWQEFGSIMNCQLLGTDGLNGLIQVCHLLFDHLERLFAALYPVQEQGWGFTASTLNPDAGQHPVPDNPLALEAAVNAARRCREEFPYFDLRYQERGKSFAKSDAAWLVTLTELPWYQLQLQVEWLGRVLGNRGMPRITLERQLEMLCEELLSALPEERQGWQLLQDAAVHLRAERLKLVPQADADRMIEAFRLASDDELQGRLCNSGALVVSAFCDQSAGIIDAVTSLLSWLADPGRFDQHWIAAVHDLVTQLNSALTIRDC